MKISQRDVAAMDDLDNALDSESGYTGARRIVIFSLLMFVVLGVWAWFGVLDEVSTGSGKMIPSSREQVLQSLDGGILTELNVHEGDQVQAGQCWRGSIQRVPNRTSAKARRATGPHWPPAPACTPRCNDLPLKFPLRWPKWPASDC